MTPVGLDGRLIVRLRCRGATGGDICKLPSPSWQSSCFACQLAFPFNFYGLAPCTASRWILVQSLILDFLERTESGISIFLA